MTARCRFAPSTTGYAHPGTLLSGLLSWLDARTRPGHFLLRLEDLDKQRCRPAFATQMQDDLRWFGLDWDALSLQHEACDRHEAALDALAAKDALYPCHCSRADLRAAGVASPDGGFAYPNTCAHRSLPKGGWRASLHPLRARLPDKVYVPVDEGGVDLQQNPRAVMGDPIVRRRDGAVAYNLAVVVDDAAANITSVVRGIDIAPSTATQVALQELLGLPTPRYRHHFLLLESRGQKLAKLHGSVTLQTLKSHYDPPALCGRIAAYAGLCDAAVRITPQELLSSFRWEAVRTTDRCVDFLPPSAVAAAEKANNDRP